MDRLIDLRSVHVRLDDRDVLHDVTLQSNAMRIGIVGRNGSGKSTLARALAGLVDLVSGRVHIAGVDVHRDRRGALGAVGLLFQNPDHQIIFPTIEEELGFGLERMGLGRDARQAQVAAILERFGWRDWGPRAIESLSQGQRQLVCLMAILAMEPRVIVLDEPFTGLDIPTRMRLDRALLGIDATLVLISHEPDDLRKCGHILWLEDGRDTAAGPPAPILAAYEARMRDIGSLDG